MQSKAFFSLLVAVLCTGVYAFVVNAPATSLRTTIGTAGHQVAAEDTQKEDEYVAKRIVVKGDVQGGYYRACVLNEAGRFRRLVGTMSPPDDTDTAEIYVEGKSKMVDGFVRWCRRSNVGLSQIVRVEEVKDEDPTGLYDDFYCKTK